MIIVNAVQAFAADLERLYTGFSTLDAEVLVAAGRNGQPVAASLNMDDAQINRLLLQVCALCVAFRLVVILLINAASRPMWHFTMAFNDLGLWRLASTVYMLLDVVLSRADVFAVAVQIVQVGNDHGIRFPRELGMLLKQLLYFDRYTRILAPELSVLDDDRIRMR